MVTRGTTKTDCGHEVALAGAWSVSADSAPAIIERRDEDFIAALLEDLNGDNYGAISRDFRPTNTGSDGLLRLYQPVHRVFNLALLESHCASFGSPRLDSQQIESSGLVVRRITTSADGAKTYEAWCATKSKVTGWVPLPDVDDRDHDRDPDVTKRPQIRYTADAAFDRERFGAGNQSNEETSSLFIAPPETAKHTTRTILYGVIPVSSSSRAGAMAKGTAPTDSQWVAHLSPFLKTTGAYAMSWPNPPADPTQNAGIVYRSDLTNFPVTLNDLTVSTGSTRFILLVRQLAQEFSLLRPINPTTRDQLVTALNAVSVTLVDNTTTPAGDYLVKVARVYFEQPDPALDTDITTKLTVVRPKTWPAIDATTATSIQTLLKQISSEIELSTFSSESNAGRFDDPTSRYVIRAFIRVKQPCDCPPKIVWSPYSESFSIAPWFESSPVGPVPVILPDLTPDFLNKAKPNVAFSVPAKLANVLNQDAKKFFDGSAGKGSGFELDWICGFNIPIITICAFIVLNIMLSLLNIIFFWLPFVKICIPFPRKK